MKPISTLDNLRNMSRNNPLRAIQTLRDDVEMGLNKNVEADDLAEMSLDGSELDLNAALPTESSTSSEPTETGFTGTFLSVTGKEFNSEVYNIGGVNAGVLQFGLSQTNGKAYAGAGAVVISEEGINLKGDNTSYARSAAINFVDSGNNEIGKIYEIYSASTQKLFFDNTPFTSTDSSSITLSSNASGIGGSTAEIRLDAYNASSGVFAGVLLNSENGVIINETGHDLDTRIESDGNANAIFVDAGNNRVGIMNGSPTVALDVTGAILASSNITSNAFFNMGATNAQTINAGVITVTGGRCVVDTQGGAATDDLDTINGGSDGDILVIYTANSARDVTAKDGTGNLALAGDFVMTNIRDRLVLLKDSGTWVELSRSDNQ